MSVILNGINLTPSSGSVVLGASSTSWVSSAITGDISLNGSGLSTIQNGTITNPKVGTTATGALKVGNGTGVSDLTVGTGGQVLLSNGTTPTWTTLSGGVSSVSSTGVVTLNNTFTTPVVAKTANYTILNSDVNTLFTSSGATSTVVLTLPASATVGARFYFACLAAQTLTITAPTTNSIQTSNNGVTALGTSLSFAGSVSLYGVVQVLALTSTTWLVMDRTGPWTLT